MIREAFKVIMEGFHGEEDTNPYEFPRIVKVEITDQEGVSWQKAKAQLRQFYLNKAKELRTVTQESYFS